MLRRTLLLILIFGLLHATAFATEVCTQEGVAKAESLLKEAKSLFKQNFSEPAFKQAYAKTEKAVQACPTDENAWAFQSQMAWMIGEFLPKKAKKDRVAWYKKGEKAADQALAINKDSVGGHFWKASNMAGRGDAKGWAASIWMFPKLLKHMDKVDELDPHYIYGATDRFWCEVLNRVPLTLADKFGYKVDDVVADIEAEIKAEPRFFANYVYAARIYWKAKKKEKALTHLEHVLKTDPGVFPEEKADNAFHKKMAAKLWREYTGKDFPNK